MGITTKQGDNGFTFSFTRDKVLKNDILIELSGTIDEAVTFIGYAKTIIYSKKIKDFFSHVQNNLLSITKDNMQDYYKESLDYIENFPIKNKNMLLKKFILPGKNKKSISVHLARVAIRRLERAFIAVYKENEPQKSAYLNRLSDIFFLLAESFT